MSSAGDATKRPAHSGPRVRPAAGSPASEDDPTLQRLLDGAEILRRPATATEAWLLAKGDRVQKVFDLRRLDERERLRIEAEASIGLSLGDIAGAVPTLSVVEDDGWLVLEMPRMGESLRKHLDRTDRGERPRLSSEDYADALAGVAETLQGMHDRGLVHRDVKPEGLLANPDASRLAIGEFAITRSDSRAEEAARPQATGWRRLTRTHEVLGTDRYVAPEQFSGEVGPSVDQYALGVTAHDVFTAPGAAGPPAAIPCRPRGPTGPTRWSTSAGAGPSPRSKSATCRWSNPARASPRPTGPSSPGWLVAARRGDPPQRRRLTRSSWARADMGRRRQGRRLVRASCRPS